LREPAGRRPLLSGGIPRNPETWGLWNDRGGARLCANGGDDRDGRKVGPVAPAITREQLLSGHRGVAPMKKSGNGRDADRDLGRPETALTHYLGSLGLN